MLHNDNLSESELFMKNNLEENFSRITKNTKKSKSFYQNSKSRLDDVKSLNIQAIDLFTEQKFEDSLRILKEVEKIYLVNNLNEKRNMLINITTLIKIALYRH